MSIVSSLFRTAFRRLREQLRRGFAGRRDIAVTVPGENAGRALGTTA
jgi:hypothetical protein